MNIERLQSKYNRRLIFCWVFIFLFFIIYNVFSKIGVIPKVFGGFYTFSILFSSLIVCGLFFGHLILSFKYLIAGRINVLDCINVIFLSFIFLFVFRVIVGYFQGGDLEIIEPLGGAAVRFFCLYVMCVYMPVVGNDFYKANFFCFLVATFSLVVFYFVGGNDFIISDANSLQGVDSELDYQGTAAAYSMLVIFGVNYIKRTSLRFLCWVVSLCLLFLIGARSEFILVLIVFLGLEFVFDKSRMLNLFLLIEYGLFFVLACMCLLFFGYDLGVDSRMGGLIDIARDESVIAREYLNGLGYQTIQNNLFFGDFASYYPGQYMHNIFSVWVDLGFLGFLLLFIIFILCAVLIFESKITKERSIVLMLFFSCVVLLIFAKAYFYIILPVALGVFVGCFSKRV